MKVVGDALRYYHDHPAFCMFAATWVYGTVIDGMPPPEPSSGIPYRWAYKVGHAVAANLSRLRRPYYPNDATASDAHGAGPSQPPPAAP